MTMMTDEDASSSRCAVQPLQRGMGMVMLGEDRSMHAGVIHRASICERIID
jgi:hypothetical protein